MQMGQFLGGRGLCRLTIRASINPCEKRVGLEFVDDFCVAFMALLLKGMLCCPLKHSKAIRGHEKSDEITSTFMP
jgi:hypothetical protein